MSEVNLPTAVNVVEATLEIIVVEPRSPNATHHSGEAVVSVAVMVFCSCIVILNFKKRILETSVLREWGDEFNHVSFFTQIQNGKTLTDMSIFVDEEKRGLGLARRMMQRLFFECDKDVFDSTYVYIDTDCSDGFWEHVGFVANPLYETTGTMEYGYEKRISWEQLRTFAHTNGK